MQPPEVDGMRVDGTPRRSTIPGGCKASGFRYVARSIAQLYAVIGYVKNLPDGRVELIVEGMTVDVSGLLRAISVRKWAAISATCKKRLRLQPGSFPGLTSAFDGLVLLETEIMIGILLPLAAIRFLERVPTRP